MTLRFTDKRSIRFRLTAWYAGIFAATFALAGITLLWAMRKAANDTVDKELRSRLPEIREYLVRESGQHGMDGVAAELEEQAGTRPGGAWLRIADASGNWVYRSARTKEWDSAPPSLAGLSAKGRTGTISIRGKTLRVLTAPVPPGVLQIGAPMDEFDELFDAFAWAILLASPLLLLLASAGGYWMSGRALKPVDTIAATVREIEAGNLSERLRLRGTGDELDRLSETVNEMLTRLESAFRRITRFTADASHELRTPVAIIRTTAEVIGARPRTSAEHEAAWQQVVSQTERTSHLIEDLLILARADSGHDRLAFEPVDLADILREVTAEMHILADEAGLHLTTSIPPRWLMRGEPDALRRILINLVDNAIKYTPPGGSVEVTLKEEHLLGSCAAVIQIRDTGVGIAEEDLPHVFDRFYRTAPDRSRRTGGGGLGLSIAQSLAALHKGEITVASIPGAGSVFRLVLPGNIAN